MNARDLMSRDVATVGPDTPLRDVAKVLLTHQISAVPVVDSSGFVVGMVSEGDLIGRKKTEREARSEEWLMRLSEGEPLSEEFLAHAHGPLAVAREVMSSPVISVGEETLFDEIASLMAEYRIKRVPVVRDGRLVGIVRRADLLRTIGDGPSAPVSRPPEPLPRSRNGHQDAGGQPAIGTGMNGHPALDVPDGELAVSDFRHLVEHHKAELDLARSRDRAAAAESRRKDVRRLIDTHISDHQWNALLHHAREAAERGETESLLLRFPSQLCSDGGRAVNVPDPEWPATLRGEAAEIYLRWERELRPRGFHITARVVEFPDGLPGDMGLFLAWGE
jgi:CBS domain-containing protein